MNLGLLGFDDATATLARAATRAGDRIGPVADVPADAPLPAGARRVTWEDLLDADSCDAVAVAAGGWHEGRADAVRKLVQAGRTLLLVQPLDLSMLFAWELDMIRRDSGARLVPVLSDRERLVVERMLEDASDAEVAAELDVEPNNLHQIRWRAMNRLRAAAEQAESGT